MQLDSEASSLACVRPTIGVGGVRVTATISWSLA